MEQALYGRKTLGYLIHMGSISARHTSHLFYQALTDDNPNMRRVAIAELGDLARSTGDAHAIERLKMISTFYDAPDDARGGAFREMLLIDERRALEKELERAKDPSKEAGHRPPVLLRLLNVKRGLRS